MPKRYGSGEPALHGHRQRDPAAESHCSACRLCGPGAVVWSRTGINLHNDLAAGKRTVAAMTLAGSDQDRPRHHSGGSPNVGQRKQYEHADYVAGLVGSDHPSHLARAGVPLHTEDRQWP